MAAIGGPRALAGKASRLVRAGRLWLDRREIRRRLRTLAERGDIDEQPGAWRIFFGGFDMLRFVSEPASRDDYRQKGVSFGFHQRLRALHEFPLELAEAPDAAS